MQLLHYTELYMKADNSEMLVSNITSKQQASEIVNI